MAPVIPYWASWKKCLSWQKWGWLPQQALDQAGLTGGNIDAVIVACSNFQRVYPPSLSKFKTTFGMKGGLALIWTWRMARLTLVLSAVGTIRAGVAKRVAILYCNHLSASQLAQPWQPFIYSTRVALPALLLKKLTPQKVTKSLTVSYLRSLPFKNRYAVFRPQWILAAGTPMLRYQRAVTDKFVLARRTQSVSWSMSCRVQTHCLSI